MLQEFIPGKLGLRPGVIQGVDATKFIPVIIFVDERTMVCRDWLVAGFFTVEHQFFGFWADKLSEDIDFLAENPGFKIIDFFSLPRLNLILK